MYGRLTSKSDSRSGAGSGEEGALVLEFCNVAASCDPSH